MLSKVFFLSRRQAESVPGKTDVIVISIADHGSPVQLQKGFRSIFSIAFDDYDKERDGLDAGKTPFSLAQSVSLKDWINPYAKLEEPLILLVHCNAGISRSAAVAWWVHKTYGANLQTDFPVYHLNRHVLKTLDPNIDGPLLPENAQTIWELIADGRQEHNFWPL